jgi:hypothetical protein
MTLIVSAVQAPVELGVVLERSKAYVKDYEAKLGSLIGVEDYAQNSSWRTSTGMVGRRQQRRLTSDFLILQVGPEWMAVRNVNRIDGRPVHKNIEDFKQIFDESPAAILRTLKSIAEDNARFNIGDIRRNINLPTFALLVLRDQHFPRFSFEKAAELRVEGVAAWQVPFREQQGPALIKDETKQDQFSYGFLWIEPQTGAVLKSELNVGGRGTGLPYQVRVIVTYSRDEKLNMLLPKTMSERYESAANVIDCRADYSRFTRFEVEVKFDIRKPPALH